MDTEDSRQRTVQDSDAHSVEVVHCLHLGLELSQVDMLRLGRGLQEAIEQFDGLLTVILGLELG